jgi:hypothetical protein
MKVLWIVGGVFFTVGLGLATGGGLLWGKNARFAAEAGKAEGEVVDLISYRSDKSTMYKPLVRFHTEGGQEISFSGNVGSSSPSYARGDKVQVLYDRGTPEKAEIDSFMERGFAAVMLLGMGLVFGGVGGGLLAYQIRQRRIRAGLMDNGMRVEAKVTGVDYDTSLTVNGRHPWRLSCQWQHPVTGAVHVFHSDAIWYDPSEYVQRETLPVRVNADKPSEHWVDTSFLPKAG